jgi:hypothetical protein
MPVPCPPSHLSLSIVRPAFIRIQRNYRSPQKQQSVSFVHAHNRFTTKYFTRFRSDRKMAHVGKNDSHIVS